MDTSKDKRTIKPLEPAYVTPAGALAAALVFALSYFAFPAESYPVFLRIIMCVSFAAIAEVAVSNLMYVRALRGTAPRLFLPEVNDVEAVVTKDIGARRRKGGEVAFEYESMNATCRAITESDEPIEAGSRVRIIRADSDSTVTVEKLQ